MLIQIK